MEVWPLYELGFGMKVRRGGKGAAERKTDWRKTIIERKTKEKSRGRKVVKENMRWGSEYLFLKKKIGWWDQVQLASVSSPMPCESGRCIVYVPLPLCMDSVYHGEVSSVKPPDFVLFLELLEL